ncbi:MAG: hypothetical protein AABX04_04295 [Nanoarchaeota archaeon]
MKSLETQVREALISQNAEELVKCTVEFPEYKAMAVELAETVFDSMVEQMAPTLRDADEEEKAEMRQEYRKEVLPQIQAQFDNPEKLRQTMYKHARNQYMSVRQLRAKLKPHFAEMREDEGIDEGVAANYERAYEGLFEFVKTNDEIIRRLTKVAKTEGIDKATQKEARYAVIKEMFPTPDEYRTFAQRGMEVVRNFYQQAQSALMADGELGQDMGMVFEAMGKAIEKAQESVQKIQGNYLEKTIQEIYG